MDIAICDDDKNICTQIENTLLAYTEKHSLKLNIEVFYSGETFVEYLQKSMTFDLIYLDIEMSALNGIEVGSYIRKILKNHKVDIVFISGKNNYDRQLFEVQPLHFIPKPLIESMIIDDLKLAMERADKKMEVFHYNKGCDAYGIPINEIIYFESLGRTIKIVTVEQEDFFYSSMDEVILMVSKHQFLHIHRSYLVNYNHIIKLTYSDATMSDHRVITIGRTKRKELRKLQIEE